MKPAMLTSVATSLTLFAATALPCGSAFGADTPARVYAQMLHKRLAGTALQTDDPRLALMENATNAGNFAEAARLATESSGFLNVTIRDFASVMSNREETPFTTLDDFQALIIGTVRDNADARTLLTGDFRYEGRANLGLPPVESTNNNHYMSLEATQADIAASLVKVSPQRAGLPDAAGLLTTRAWGLAHLSAGTNRRSIEYSFREFMCTPIAVWRDTGRPDDFVRRDVNRSPGDKPEEYQTLCRTCHAQMDAMSPAFARFDFVDGQLLYLGQRRVAGKMNRNAHVYPPGYEVQDDGWRNLATEHHNEAFGWRGPLTGQGAKAFGTMLANSRGFSTCMVKRAFKGLCKREPLPGETFLINEMAGEFETGGYNLKNLFIRVASDDSCIETPRL